MKLFLVNFSRTISIDIAKALKEKGMEIVYWTGGKAEFDEFSQETKDFPNTVFHNYFDALQAKPAPAMDLSQFRPVSQDVIDKLSKYEAQILVMMSRMDFEGMSIEARRNLYHQYVDYWYNVLTILKPDALIFSDIPHTIFNTIIYNIAKLLNIRTVLTRRVNGLLEHVIVFEDFRNYQELKDAYHDLQKKDFGLEDLPEDLKQYYLDQSKPGANLTTFFQRFMTRKAKDAEALPRFTSIIKNIKNATFFKTTKSYFKMMFGQKRYITLEKQYYSGWAIKKKDYRLNKIRQSFKQEYLDLQSPADFSKKFVYLPLHFQPECSTNPMGGVFDDQILMINILSAALPKDWFIYVKEHSIQWKGSRAHIGRYQGYYQQIAKLENVKLLPADTPPNELIEKSQAIATITGTAGWEGLMKLKPVLVFGYIWYMDCNGAFRVDDFDSCQKAFTKIADGYQPSAKDIIKFLGATEKVSLKGYLKSRYSDESKINYEDNLKNITKILYNKLIKKS
jgi:hypothetical protein